MTDLAEPAQTLGVPVPAGGQTPHPAFAPPAGLTPSTAMPPPPQLAAAVPHTIIHEDGPAIPEYHPPAATPAAAAPIAASNGPVVPTISAAAPVAATPRPEPTTSGMPDYAALAATTATGKGKRKRGGFGKFLFVMILLGGLGAAGYVYGPTILERIEEETSDEPPAAGEPEAPLAFPSQSAPAMEVRVATFVLDDVDSDGATRRYEVTTDFETRVSRVLIDRAELPTLEVMTFLDSAVVRRVDDTIWYQTPRGQFPLDDQLDRDRWVRHLDELIPEPNRRSAAIEASTTSLLAGEQMRHLVISIDPALLGGPTLASDTLDGNPVVEPVAQPAGFDAASGNDAATGEALRADLQADVQPGPPVAGAGDADRSPGDPSTTTSPDSAAAVQIEIWVDDHGLIRQLITPDTLGGEVVTVTAISPDAWVPEYPPQEEIEPLTASALVKLGL